MKKLLILLAVLCSSVLWVQAETKTDEITISALGSPASYAAEQGYTSSTTGIKYSSRVMKSTDYKEIQSKAGTVFLSVAANSNNVILKKVQITYSSGSTARNIGLYAYDKAYTISEETKSVVSGETATATLSSSSTSYSFSDNDNVKFFYLKNASDKAVYLSKIEVTWEEPISDTDVMYPVFSPADGSTIGLTQDITLSCKTPDATILYALDGSTTYSEYTASSKINFSTTGKHSISAYAVKEGLADSQTVSATYNVVDMSKSHTIAFVADGYEYTENNPTYTLEADNDITNNTSPYTYDGVCSISFDQNGAQAKSKVADNVVYWYSGNLIKVTPADGTIITGIKFYTTTKYAKITIGDNSITPSSSSPYADFTGLAYTEEFKISNGGQIRFYYMEVTYVSANDTPATPTLGELKATMPDGSAITEGKAYTVTAGDKLTFSAENATNILVRNADKEEITEGAEFDSEAYTLTWTPAVMTEEEITVLASIGDGDDAPQASIYFTLTVNAKSTDLGEIKGYLPNNDAIGEDITIVEGTTLTFTAENAEVMSMFEVDDDDNETAIDDAVFADGKLTWTPDVSSTKYMRVKASRGKESAEPFDFLLTVTEKQLGEVIGSANGTEFKAAAKDEAPTAVTITENQTITFKAENASSIVLYDSEAEEVTDATFDAETGILTWSPAYTSKSVKYSVKATYKAQSTGFDFTVKVNALEVGDIVAKYGDTTIAKDASISVATGTEFTFTATNATNICIETMDAETNITELASAEGNSITWTVDNDVVDMYIVVSAWRYEQNTDITKSISFTLTAETPQNRTFIPVTSADQLVEGKNYIITSKITTNGSDKIYVLGTTANSKNIAAATTTFTDATEINIETTNEDCRILVLGGNSTDGYYLSDGGSATQIKYLNPGTSTSDNYLYFTHQTTTTNALFKPTFRTNGTVDIAFTCKSSHNHLFYNNNNTSIFSAYDSTFSNGKAITLYVEYVPAPTVYNDEVAKTVQITSQKGQLYINVKEYDGSDQLVTSEASQAKSVIARVASDETDESIEWGEPIAQGQTVTIDAPTEANHYKIIKTKSVSNGVASDVTTVRLNANGTVSGIDGIAADSQDATVEYYNLQGVRVSNPGTGLYIRRQGTKVEKVAIR